MIKTKLCGLSRREDVLEINKLKPDYVGFVFYEKSRRNISKELALELRSLLKKEIQSVGVFVNEDPERIRELYESGCIQLAQLHGKEEEQDIRILRESCPGLKLIQAFQIRMEEDLRRAEQSSADYVLLDSGMGSGESFDWVLLRSFRRPYFLAGGLNPENVREAAEKLLPYGVDVSSGIETDGKKDPVKMRKFMTAVEGL